VKLSEGIELYIQYKRTHGVGFEKGYKNFEGFSKGLGSVSLSEIQTRDVLHFLNGPKTSAVTFRSKHSQLRYFFEHWAIRGVIPEFAMPPNRPLQRQTFTPYIYTRQEIYRLLGATRVPMTAANTLNPQTLRTFLITLYTTGALAGEIIQLTTKDVDLRRGFITIRTTRFNRCRKLPIGKDLLGVLQRYAAWKKRANLNTEVFFPRIDGTQIVARTLNGIFQRLRRRARIARHDGACYQPRMHDLRATFAVHRITSWIRNKADLNRMLPALSVYMGQVGLSSTERYLYMTPERFRKELNRLSPMKPKRHWRDDPALLQFLSTL
jgi:integrase/recombinase XerD